MFIYYPFLYFNYLHIVTTLYITIMTFDIVTVPCVLSPMPHILPTTCMLSLAGPRFIFVAKTTGSRSSTSLYYVKPPLLSAQWSPYQHQPVARAQAGIFHWSSQKPTAPLVAFLSSSLLPMTEVGDSSPSLNLSISCQSNLPIMVPVHSPSVNCPPNYLIPILLFITCSFAPQYFYLHIHLPHIYFSSV